MAAGRLLIGKARQEVELFDAVFPKRRTPHGQTLPCQVLLVHLLHGCLLLAVPQTMAASAWTVAHFEEGDLVGWQHQVFAGETRYRLVNREGVRGLLAESASAASGLFREMTVNLREFPILRWRWRVLRPLSQMDENHKQGDDFAARLFVVARDPLMFWRSRSINYVWSAGHGEGEVWNSPYSDHTRMVAVAGAGRPLDQWISHRMNVAADFQRFFGEEVPEIHAIAVMTDTDNTGQQALALYGDMTFESR